MIEIVWTCSRTDCDEVETSQHGELDVDFRLIDLLPDGWGFDFAGLDQVLHCDEHRS